MHHRTAFARRDTRDSSSYAPTCRCGTSRRWRATLSSSFFGAHEVRSTVKAKQWQNRGIVRQAPGVAWKLDTLRARQYVRLAHRGPRAEHGKYHHSSVMTHRDCQWPASYF